MGVLLENLFAQSAGFVVSVFYRIMVHFRRQRIEKAVASFAVNLSRMIQSNVHDGTSLITAFDGTRFAVFPPSWISIFRTIMYVLLFDASRL